MVPCTKMAGNDAQTRYHKVQKKKKNSFIYKNRPLAQSHKPPNSVTTEECYVCACGWEFTGLRRTPPIGNLHQSPTHLFSPSWTLPMLQDGNNSKNLAWSLEVIFHLVHSFNWALCFNELGTVYILSDRIKANRFNITILNYGLFFKTSLLQIIKKNRKTTEIKDGGHT